MARRMKVSGSVDVPGARWQTRCRVVADRAVDLLDSRLAGGRTFAAFQERNIARTLAALHDDLAVPV
ncbi:hypothetical protein [Knoellia sp. LjRoot47]|uniref:hypothetical protein n=1 Tax=Knoellia sp. LjRoot47 TaxID=3342330 RepID=UPI003ECE8B17